MQIDDIIHVNKVVSHAEVIIDIADQGHATATVLQTHVKGQRMPGMHLDVQVTHGGSAIHAQLVVVVVLVVGKELIVMRSIFETGGSLDERAVFVVQLGAQPIAAAVNDGIGGHHASHQGKTSHVIVDWPVADAGLILDNSIAKGQFAAQTLERTHFETGFGIQWCEDAAVHEQRVVIAMVVIVGGYAITQ